MSEGHTFREAQVQGSEGVHAQPALPATNVHRGPIARPIHCSLWLLPGIALLSVVTLMILSYQSLAVPEKAPTRQFIPTSASANEGLFREYALRKESEVMRPAIDHLGRIWFGAMGQNALVVFDPHIRTFQYLTPPHGRHGIMGVQVAPDDTIWFAEQYANYIGHYFPSAGRFQIYTLPWITITDPGHVGQKLSLPSAPNELALDAHGEVWFTEFNADRLGRLDPKTGHIQNYPLSSKPSVQTLYPYGVTVDRQGNVWFTESGRNQLGRLEPRTGAIHVFSVPDPQALTMEIASDELGSLWVTSFTPGLLFRYEPHTETFTTYIVSLTGNERGTLYGLLVPTPDDIWVTILAANMLAHLDVRTGRLLFYHIPTPDSLPLGLAMDANHNLWYTGLDTIGTLHPARTISQ
jgi:virginiamycin B lyase